mgnify:FL=1
MIKIITAVNNPDFHEELKKEKNLKIIGRDIQYKEGILELLENNKEINYIIIDEKIPGEIEINKLIEKILEINKKILIIFLIKKENINKKILINKNIKILYYEKELSFKEIKKNYETENYSEDNNIENKINKSKIINFLGEKQVGKTLTIYNISNYLGQQNKKILIIDFNKKNEFIKNIFKNKINIEKNIKIKNKINIVKNKNYKLKYLNKKIINKIIIKINKNIDLILKNKIINFNLIIDLTKKYDYIFIESNFNKKNNKIINKIEKNILIIRPNILSIKNSEKIIEKNKDNNFKLIMNNYNKNSIDEEIIKKIFYKNEVIGKIDYQIEYEKIINSNFKKKKIKDKKYNENLKDIINKIV